MNIDFAPYFAPDTGAATAEPTDDTAADDTSGESAGDEAGTDTAPEPTTQDAADQEWDINTLQQKGELNESMREIGGNLGRDQPDEETGAGDETGAEPSSGEAPEETEEPEQGAPEDETEEDEPAEAENEAEQEGEDEDEDEESVDAEPLPDEVQETVNEHFPGRVVETTEDLGAVMEETRETLQIFDAVDREVEEDSDLAHYFELRFQEGASTLEAKVRAFGDLEDAPDKEENPEAYADWVAEYREAKKTAEQDEAAEEQISEAEQRLEEETERSFLRLKEERDMSDEEFHRFTEAVNKLVFGDDRGRVPSDQAERLYFALNKDDILEEVRQEAYEEGRKEGRNEQVEGELSDNGRGDGLPNPGGTAEPEEPKSDREEELEALGSQFENRGGDPDEFSW